MFAIKHYDNPLCVDEQEFLDDTTKELKARLIINHVIILANVFGIDAATTLLFFKIDTQHWSILKTILVFLHYMPENDMINTPINHNVMGQLGKI